jgi:hypothetical protein
MVIIRLVVGEGVKRSPFGGCTGLGAAFAFGFTFMRLPSRWGGAAAVTLALMIASTAWSSDCTAARSSSVSATPFVGRGIVNDRVTHVADAALAGVVQVEAAEVAMRCYAANSLQISDRD